MHWMQSGISGIGGSHLDGKAPGGGVVVGGGPGGGVGHNSQYAQSSLGWFAGMGWFEDMGCTVLLSSKCANMFEFSTMWEWWDDICWVISQVCS